MSFNVYIPSDTGSVACRAAGIVPSEFKSLYVVTEKPSVVIPIFKVPGWRADREGERRATPK